MTIIKKLFHPPEYPVELKTKPARAGYFFEWHMYLMDQGRGKVIGKVTQLFPEMTLFVMVLDKLGYVDLTMTKIIGITCIGMFSVWFCGWCYIMLGMDKIGHIMHRYRDVMFKSIYDKVNKQK